MRGLVASAADPAHPVFVLFHKRASAVVRSMLIAPPAVVAGSALPQMRAGFELGGDSRGNMRGFGSGDAGPEFTEPLAKAGLADFAPSNWGDALKRLTRVYMHNVATHGALYVDMVTESAATG